MKRISYAQRDHDTIVADVVERLKLHYPDKWNDAYEDDLGMMLIETIAYTLDILNYYLDRQANETYLPTATERQNIINICKLVGYLAKNAVPVSANLMFSQENARETDVIIRRDAQILTRAGTTFELAEDVIIPAGQLSSSGAAVQGETFDELLKVIKELEDRISALQRRKRLPGVIGGAGVRHGGVEAVIGLGWKIELF
ncbi:MAG: hypothetical protein LBC93_06845 [Synergistaceae bacterium]|jgi:hypothetical protein|nr:hypothetical protein [Synergistaceae bacterium]